MFYNLTIITMEIVKWQKFWLWLALWCSKRVCNDSGRWTRYELCKCKCWTEKYVRRDHLYHWRTISCGCNNLKTNIYKSSRKYSFKLYWVLNNSRHGMVNTSFYKKYMWAKRRCENINDEKYKSYWWRWIKILWHSFKEFKNDMYSSYIKHCKEFWEKETTLDRIDVNWNYCKDNCRWATWTEQMNNMQKSRKVTYMWITYSSVSDLCNKIWRMKDRAMIGTRIRRWMSVEDAVLIPKKFNVKKQ